jgi:Fur family ferric uptake transcriptional regulator
MERNTTQRAAIWAALTATDRPLSPQEVLDAARLQVPTLGPATVYRTLNALAADGSLIPVTLPGEPARYEVAGKKHHHHFFCRLCRRVFELAGCPGRLSRLGPPGFRVDHHDVTLYGVCADCGAASKPE